jgi:hypothetical protein
MRGALFRGVDLICGVATIRCVYERRTYERPKITTLTFRSILDEVLRRTKDYMAHIDLNVDT